jgi:hypothetical protein
MMHWRACFTGLVMLMSACAPTRVAPESADTYRKRPEVNLLAALDGGKKPRACSW